ncbi:hypothetical protein GH714_009569 [Hevea brasiliensis]|uniref:Methyltransferase n=1 Tax=Hevea brasiliensis TaxID=3981 RepID=A0A6A6M776_HEVBR|nr:hypothetical protein GH714_009569 [Hevea brasiliensis]
MKIEEDVHHTHKQGRRETKRKLGILVLGGRTVERRQTAVGRWKERAESRNEAEERATSHFQANYLRSNALIALLGLICFYNASSVAPGLSRSNRYSFSHDGTDPVLGGFSGTRDIDDLFQSKSLKAFLCLNSQMINFTMGNVRNVLDVGCGVASFGAYLLAHDIIAMSIAPNDVHENQIQFALERGIPSTLGVLGTKRLPFPSRSFELAHCSRCRIDWLQRDGILLLELDRLLRPGGYFAYSSPEAYAHDPENRRIWNAMHDLLRRMCWRVVVRKDQTVIWAKPTKMHKVRGSGLVPWPQRLTEAPPRLEEIGVSAEEFHEDTRIWQFRVSEYWKQMKSVVRKSYFRNVMDMNSNLGVLVLLSRYRLWLVEPEYSDYGMTSVPEWCEAFSTYPRTYDLLHAWQIFTKIQEHGCGLEDLLIEMDRILRPEGFVIIRDKPSIVNYIRKFVTALRWDRWISEVEPKSDALSSGEEQVLIVRKKLWSGIVSTM